MAAHASISVDLRFIGVGPDGGLIAPLSLNGTVVSGRVGQLHWQASNDGGSPPFPLTDSAWDADASIDNLTSFCIEIGQTASRSWHVYERTAVQFATDPPNTGNPLSGVKIGVERAAALDKLADNFWGLATGGSLVDAVAFQFAVWEIVHESTDVLNNSLPGNLNVSQTEGTFFVDILGPTGDLLTAIARANDWLSDLPSLGSDDAYSVIAITNPNRQDQLVQIPERQALLAAVPEPAAALVWAVLAMAGITGYAWSKRS